MAKTKQLPHQGEDFNGYTLDELRYMKAYEAARMEIARDRISQSLNGVRNTSAVLTSGVISKVVGSFSYIELGFIAFKTVKRLLKLFRRK